MVYLKYLIVGGVLLRMVVAGFISPPGRFLSWPMFTRMSIVIPVIRCGQCGSDLNIFSLRAPGAFTIGTSEFGLMIKYLTMSGHDVNGYVDLLWAYGRSVFQVRRGYVDLHGLE